MKTLLRLLGSLVLTLLIAELLLWGVERLARGETQGSDRRAIHQPRPDREWLYGLRPGARGTFGDSEILYEINADGYRDRLYERPKPDGVYRILVLGDSVAFGYGVEAADSYPKRLERHLAALTEKHGGPPIEVLNLAVGGYNPYNQAALLDDLGASFDPDLVLVQFCINDLNDPTAHFDVQTRLHLGTIPDAAYPDPSARTEAPEPPSLALRLCRRSRLCSVVDDAMLAAVEVAPQDREGGNMMRPVERGDGPEWPWLERLYRRMARTSADMDASFAVVAFPYRDQLAVEEAPVQRLLVEMGERNGWTTVDPLDRFRVATAEGQALFLDWWHPTMAGNTLAAGETARALACADLLPGEISALCSESP